MNTPFQAISSRRTGKFTVLLGGVAAFLTAATALAEDLGKNIVVLVDQSLSVEAANRDSALKMVAGLVTGKVDAADRQAWKFTPVPNSPYPSATANCGQLLQSAGQPLATASARFVIAPLGNYERIAPLRAMLASQAVGTPDEIAGRLLNPLPPFQSVDKSTHVTLAEAVVAGALLQSGTETPYYLIVISDFYEDCLNRPIDEYKTKGKEIERNNARVLAGEAPFKDDEQPLNEKNKYQSADLNAIRFLNEKIKNLQLGEFIYQAKTSGGIPVNVRIYSPYVKRDLKFAAAGSSKEWILPDAAPVFEVSAEGFKPEMPLEIKWVNAQAKQEITIRKTCGLLAKGRLDLSALMEDNDEIQSAVAPGAWEIVLSVPQAAGPPLEAKAGLIIVQPKMTLGDSQLAESTEAKPYEFDPQEIFMEKAFSVVLNPAPKESCTIEIKPNDGKPTRITIDAGAGEFSLKELGVKPEGGVAIGLSASLPLPPTRSVLAAKCWLEIAKDPTIWAEYMGAKLEGSEVALNQTLDLTLKASHAGMEGYDWIETYARSLDDPSRDVVRFDDPNNLNFDDCKPGKYLISAKFGLKKSPTAAEFTVGIPSKTPWMLIALGTMGVLSIGLFGWHFFRR